MQTAEPSECNAFLVEIPIHLQDSADHIFVEVVLHGQTEGKFLEEPGAHSWETMGQVSKLGGFWPTDKLTIPLIGISSLLDPRRHIL